LAKKQGLLERLQNGFVLGDGGYLMELRLRGFLEKESMTPEVVAKHPEEVQRITQEFKDAGAEVLQTLTFFGTSNMLERAGFGERAEEINRTACRIARQIAGEEALVAGNLNSPSIYQDYDPSDSASQERTRAWLQEQLPWIVDEKVDFLILETFSWLDEALVALEVVRDVGLPIVATVSMEEKEGKTLDGFAADECARRMVEAGADVVGVNCLWGPDKMLDYAVAMRQAVEVPVCCQPSAWHSWWSPGDPVPPLRFAQFVKEAMREDIRFLGACCGAGPEHIEAMAQAMVS
jgi:betaine-homocysteine S-methyltransferase